MMKISLIANGRLTALSVALALAVCSCGNGDDMDAPVWDYPMEYKLQMVVALSNEAFAVRADGSWEACEAPSAFENFGALIEETLDPEETYEGLQQFTLESDSTLSGTYVYVGAFGEERVEVEDLPYTREGNLLTIYPDPSIDSSIPMLFDEDLEHCGIYIAASFAFRRLDDGSIEEIGGSIDHWLPSLEGEVERRVEKEVVEHQLSEGDTVMVATLRELYERVN